MLSLSTTGYQHFFEDPLIAILTLTPNDFAPTFFFSCQLNYASEIWAPQSIGKISNVESLKSRVTKLCSTQVRRIQPKSYKDRLMKVNLLPISFLHEIKDLLFYFRGRLGHYRCTISLLMILCSRTSSLSPRRTAVFQICQFLGAALNSQLV